jgi:tripartite-type tricarboxylate transporter receptor subunit TctC
MRGLRAIAAAAVLLSLVAVHAPSQAQSDYPNKPITLMLPLGAGGAMDILARGYFAQGCRSGLASRW